MVSCKGLNVVSWVLSAYQKKNVSIILFAQSLRMILNHSQQEKSKSKNKNKQNKIHIEKTSIDAKKYQTPTERTDWSLKIPSPRLIILV